MMELVGDCVVYLMKERGEWLTGRYVSCTWDMGYGRIDGKERRDCQRGQSKSGISVLNCGTVIYLVLLVGLAASAWIS